MPPPPPVETTTSSEHGTTTSEGMSDGGGIIIIDDGATTITNGAVVNGVNDTGTATKRRRRRFFRSRGGGGGNHGGMSGRMWLLLLLTASVALSAYHVAILFNAAHSSEVDLDYYYGSVLLRYASDVRKSLMFDDGDEVVVEPAGGGGRPKKKNEALDELIDTVTTPSLRVLLTSLRDHAPPDGSYLDPVPMLDDGHNELEEELEELRTRCERYGYTFDPTKLPPVDDDEYDDDEGGGSKNETTRTRRRRRRRRRIFMGGLIADDSWHTIAAHAAESYGLYHTVAFVESNRTQMLYEREVRFGRGSLNLRVLQSGIFGPDTNVSVDLYVDEQDRFDANGKKIGGTGGRPPNGLLREHLQREVILDAWKRNGMTTSDIGFVSDTDEMFTRDFLIAAQTCDVPQFRPGQDCKAPKVSAKTLVFEASPECITADRSWYHPDMIIGECVDTIGNSTLHKPAVREYRGKLGKRSAGYGRNPRDYGKMPTGITQYPLWKPVDFRATGGGSSPVNGEIVNGTRLHYTGYHLHNFFDSIDVLRRKYKTYGHPIRDADEKPLRKFHPDVNLTIHCVTDRDDAGDKRRRRRGGYEALVGPRPLVFEYDEYREARQAELRNMTLEDEARYGRRRRRRRRLTYLREVSGLAE